MFDSILDTPPIGFPEDTIVSFTGYYDFLGMDYLYPTFLDGYEWPTLEHAYQASRCNDESYLSRLIDCHERASCAKLIGQSCHDTPADWYQRRDDILFGFLKNRYKNKDLQQLLLSTESRVLVYGNIFHDEHLGMAWYRTATGYDSLHGENVLGSMYMAIRESLHNGTF